MGQDTPNPRGTLAVILGASRFPHAPSVAAKESFRASAEAFRGYLLSPDGMALPPENVLDLFDSEKLAAEMDEDFSNWLPARTECLRAEGVTTRDLIVYYVGHGCFSKSGADFALAIQRTKGDRLFHSSYGLSLLAETLRLHAGSLRKYVILDCCFSAAAYKEFQSTGPLEVVRQRTEGELPPEGVPAHQGTALLCASGPRVPAKAPEHCLHTMFSGALLQVLTQGDPTGDARLSLHAVGELVRTRIFAAHHDASVRPEVHSPEQVKGDIARVPLFPNRAQRPGAQATTLRQGYLEKLRASGSLTELLRAAIREVEAATGTDYNQILLSVADRYTSGSVVVADAVPGHKQRYKRATYGGLLGLSFSTGKTVNVPDVSREPRYFPAVSETRSELVVPVRAECAVIGVINSEAEVVAAYDAAVCGRVEAIAGAVGELLPAYRWSSTHPP